MTDKELLAVTAEAFRIHHLIEDPIVAERQYCLADKLKKLSGTYYSAGYRAGWNDALFVIEKHCKESKKP
jgi:hypothetical protein